MAAIERLRDSAERGGKVLGGFKEFVARGNVVDLAVGVVIGAAFTAVVNAVVRTLITPLLAAIGGQPNFSELYFTINGSQFLYGELINALLTFLIIAVVVYFFVVLPTNRLFAQFKPSTAEPTPTIQCPHCLSSIPVAAAKCAFCTTDLASGAAEPSEEALR